MGITPKDDDDGLKVRKGIQRKKLKKICSYIFIITAQLFFLFMNRNELTSSHFYLKKKAAGFFPHVFHLKENVEKFIWVLFFAVVLFKQTELNLVYAAAIARVRL
jgi:hypothetical protein